MENLVGVPPQDVLIHGPKKLLIDRYLWHSPNAGIVACYSPTERDVEDHFGVFRGVDQIEAFAQATIVSCGAYIETQKQACGFDDLKRNFVPVFISVGQVSFHGYLEQGDVFISIGNIISYKFRQMVCDGRIYKAPAGLNLDDYFSNYNNERLLTYNLSENFKLIAELAGITGRAIRTNNFK
ncbi:MAG TPA: hypothetical protein VGC01_04290 [Mucilaginibacter sp.]